MTTIVWFCFSYDLFKIDFIAFKVDSILIIIFSRILKVLNMNENGVALYYYLCTSLMNQFPLQDVPR